MNTIAPTSRKLFHLTTDTGPLVLPLTAIFVVFILGLSGSFLPSLIANRYPKYDLNTKPWFRFLNGLAAGLVLAVGYVHSLPDSFDSFSQVLTDNTTAQQFAWAGFIAMMGSLLTFAGEEFVHRRIGRFSSLHGGHGDTSHDGHDHHDHRLKSPSTSGSHTHHHAQAAEQDVAKQEAEKAAARAAEKAAELEAGVPFDAPSPRQDVIAAAKNLESADLKALEEARVQKIGYYSELYVLLFGLSFHSVFVGLALGVVTDDWPLFIAIMFHQFFEGLALGARVARAQFERALHIWILDLVFALAAPIGVATGMGIKVAIDSDPFTWGVVDGTFQALSGGILIYVSLVHMMKEEMERDEFKKGGLLLWSIYAGFAIGAGAMSIIGIWA